MPVTSETSQIIYTGTGLVSVYPYTFRIFEDSDLVVTKVLIATGVETELTLTTDYAVSGAGDEGGGDVTLVAGALAATYKLVIQRILPITQEIDLTDNESTPAATFEEAFDRLTMICQAIQEQVDRAVLSGLISTTDLSQDELTELLEDAEDAAAAAAVSQAAAAASQTAASSSASAASSSATTASTNASAAAVSAAAAAASASSISSMLDTDGTLAANSDSKIATQKATKTYVDTQISSAGSQILQFTAGDILITSADTERSTVNGSYTKLKEIQIDRSGTLRIKFDIKGTSGAVNVYGRIYRNGVAVGTARFQADSEPYTTYSEDISGWSSGDLVQIYIKSDPGGVAAYVKNFRIYSGIYTTTVITD